MSRIFTKIFGGYLFVTIILSGLIFFYTFTSIRSIYFNYLENDLKNLNYTLSLSVAPVLYERNISLLKSIVVTTGNKINARITVIDTAGKALADSRKDPETMDNHIQRPEFRDAKMRGYGQSIRYSKTLKDEMMYSAIPVYYNNSLIGYLRISLFGREIETLIGDLTEKIRNVTIIVVLAALALIYFFSNGITKPIKKLVEASHKVASGDFDVKVKLKNKDEFRRLADSFNSMTRRIKSLFGQVSEQKDKLDGIIKSLQEGFVVLDQDWNILLSNDGFKKIARSPDIIGKNIESIIGDKKFNKLVRKTGKKRKNITDEIILNDKFYIYSGNFIAATGETVIILYDITELKQFEQIKKDFVVNVSHELRTPLTAIKGFVETLEDEIEQENEQCDKLNHYLGIIHRHTERLISIVNDLLMLSNLEDASSQLVVSDINIKDLIYNVLRIFEQKLSDKNLALSCDIEEGIPNFKADSFKLEQLFINLIDNAVKYTDEGGVNISVKRTDNHLNVEIQDTGVGIPAEHLKRIFERFYTVDKSRSRILGGTGLGLSIVKHIVLLHEGEIRVESEKGSGSKFLIKLPLTKK